MAVVDLQRERQIVEQGRLQGKSDEFIKSAVLRFREQATQEQPPEEPGKVRKALDITAKRFIPERARQVATGALKGAVKTAQQIGQAALAAPALLPGGKKFGERLQEVKETTGVSPEVLVPKGAAQQIGFGAERIAEFLAPSGQITKATKGFGLFGRSVAEAGIVGAQTLAQQGEFNDDVKTGAIIGAIFPGAGALLGKAVKPTARILKRFGEKIQTVVIKPSARDVKDGFKIENVRKFDVGGSLAETVGKANTKMNRLIQGLRDTIAATSEKDVTINLNNTLKKTQESLAKRRGRVFGNIKPIQNELVKLQDEITELAGATDGVVGFVQAQEVKRGAGTKGAWIFGSADPNARATEVVYTKFYQTLRKEMEKLGTPRMRNINKDLSDLIPISNAALRRLPIDQRNNAISLTDSIGLFAAMFNPKSLALIGASKLSKSGRFGNIITKAAESLGRPREPKTTVGKRLFGQ